MPSESSIGALARLIDSAARAGSPEELLDRLPSTGDAAHEVVLSAATLDSVVEAARLLRAATEAERSAAPELASSLERHPETRARMLIDNHARYQTWGLCEELMARSFDAIVGGDPPRAVRLARLAAAVADRLDQRCYGSSLKADLQARAWGNLGNAYRCASRLRAAAAALRQADDLLLAGTGDPLELANLLSFRASLATALGDLAQVDQLLAHAYAVYEELGEIQLMARILVQRAGVFGDENPEMALTLAEKAETLLDPRNDRRLYLMARHNRISRLIDSDRIEEARSLLQSSRDLYRQLGDASTPINLAWVEARLALAEGCVEEAEARFRALLDLLLKGNHHLDAACCTLEISACRLAQGDPRGASELAATMAHHLRSWGAHARAREAWALFRHYLSVEQATEGLARELGAYLRRAWKNPRLAFRPDLDAPRG